MQAALNRKYPFHSDFVKILDQKEIDQNINSNFPWVMAVWVTS